MSKNQLLAAILKLPVADRLDLIAKVERETPRDRATSDSPEFITDLDRRYKAWLKNPARGTSWQQVQLEMKATLSKLRRSRGKSPSTASPRSNSRRPSSTTN